jgi:outer membrane protein OmpA-like peptidoglycan-associated protein
MKPSPRLYRRVALTVVLGSTPGWVQASDGYYIGIFGGANDAKNQSFKAQDNVPGAMALDGRELIRLKSDVGWLAGLTMGYAGPLFRPELEFAYRTNDVDKQRDTLFPLLSPAVTGPALSKTKSTQTISGMVNLWLDPFRDSSSVHPYVGGGAGAIDYRQKSPKYAGQNIDSDHQLVFAYQLGAGIAFDLGKRAELSLDYRLLRSDNAKFEPFDNADGRLEERYQAQSAMLTMRYYFTSAEEPIPPAPPTPVQVVPMEPAPVVVVAPPPPAPPVCQPPEPGLPFSMDGCNIGDTIVLRGVNFLFNKSSLTLNAKTLLDQVAQALKSRTDIRVELGGHTDSKGSDAYNQTLSQNRADSARQYLIGSGVGASRLTAVGKGETSPIAENETDAGREVNRRVELKILESQGGVTVAAPASAEPPAADTPTGSITTTATP